MVSFRRIPIVALLAILVGMSVFGFSYYNTRGTAQTAYDYVSVPAPTRELSAYTTITRDDITLKNYIRGTEPSDVITDMETLLDKVTLKNLHKDVPIKADDINTLNSLPNLVVVSVNIEAPRAAGVQRGDIVDIYWISVDQTGMSSVIPVASNARVVEICNASGKPIDTQATMASVGDFVKSSAEIGMIYYLLVKPEEVSGVIAGGAPKNTSIALTKKFRETTTPSANIINPTVKELTKK